MMNGISNCDIWYAANWIVAQHGEAALMHATFRADACFARGQVDNAVFWLRIRSAATALLTNTPADTTVH